MILELCLQLTGIFYRYLEHSPSYNSSKEPFAAVFTNVIVGIGSSCGFMFGLSFKIVFFGLIKHADANMLVFWLQTWF